MTKVQIIIAVAIVLAGFVVLGPRMLTPTPQSTRDARDIARHMETARQAICTMPEHRELGRMLKERGEC